MATWYIKRVGPAGCLDGNSPVLSPYACVAALDCLRMHDSWKDLSGGAP